jgi:glycerol-3-phosphate O-acyltransferase
VLAKGSLFSRLINKYWVRSHYVPVQPRAELQLDLDRPIIYLVEQNSATDLLGLQSSCLKAGLPDPYRTLKVNGQSLSATIFIDDWSLFSTQHKSEQNPDARYIRQYQQLLTLHKADPSLDIQLVPVTFYWGRDPGKQGKSAWFDLLDQRRVGALHKSLVVLKNGKDHLLRFNPPISIARLCQRHKSESAQHLAHKLAKVANRYFTQQKRSSVGPKLVNRKEMINAILAQPSLRQLIKERAEIEQRSEALIESQCRGYLQEISANFSYPWLRLFRKILGWVWNHIYQGIEVHHAQAVRQACQSGAEIIYMPCHRSHMDYLLLSSVLFEQGLTPAHVAAGVNLNFFPAGAIFRRSGAFFLRRTFKESPLYAQVFNAYFAFLFKQGYPIEFFTEGGRSRTGRLQPPKTGLLATALRTYLNQPERNVLLVPVYIGYDHIMEVATYTKELAGQKKEKESFWHVLGIVKKLGNFGRVFVNFAEPINIKHYFDSEAPNWQQSGIEPLQFKKQVDQVAYNVMVAINSASAVNALPLCAAILLASKNRCVQKTLFLEQIIKHQQLLALLKKNSLLTYAQGNAADIYQQALILKKFSESDGVVFCSQVEAMQLGYYRNNIIHLFALPGLLCSTARYLLRQNEPFTFANITCYAAKIYPLLETEYFLNNNQDLNSLMAEGVKQLQQIGLFSVEHGLYLISDELLLNLFIGHLQETFSRYQQLFLLLSEQENCRDWDGNRLVLLYKAQLQPAVIDPFDEKSLLLFLQTLRALYPDGVRPDQQQLLLALVDHAR